MQRKLTATVTWTFFSCHQSVDVSLKVFFQSIPLLCESMSSFVLVALIVELLLTSSC